MWEGGTWRVAEGRKEVWLGVPKSIKGSKKGAWEVLKNMACEGGVDGHPKNYCVSATLINLLRFEVLVVS